MALKLSQLKEGQYRITGDTAPEENRGLLGAVRAFSSGLSKAGGEFGLGAGMLGRQIQRLFPRSWQGAPGIFDEGSPANVAARESLNAKGTAEGIGKIAGTAAQFLTPTGTIARGQQVLSRAAQLAPAGTRIAARIAAHVAPEMIGTGAVSAVRSGGDIDQIAGEAGTAGAFSLALGSLGALGRSTYYPQLQDSITKALGIQGKRSGGQALQEVARKATGFRILSDRAPKLEVTNADGSVSAFDPKRASYDTTLQAWNKARKQIYDEYSSLTQKAGETATVDLTPVYENLKQILEQPRLGAYKRAAQSLINDLESGFSKAKGEDDAVDLTGITLRDAEQFLEDLNANTVKGFFKGTADNASAEINAGSARAIREALDDVITSTTGEGYQALRSQYAALKSLEDDLVRKFQQNARKIGGGLPEYMGMFASGDIIGGVLAGQPQQVAKGAILGTLAALKRKLSDPERFLKRAFKLTENDEISDLMVRLFGGAGGR